MKYTGTVTELNSLCSLTEPDWDLLDVIITKERIAIDWKEDESTYGLVLYPHDDALVEYSGRMTMRERPTLVGHASAYRWNVVGKGVLLLAKWEIDGNAGICMFELERPQP